MKTNLQKKIHLKIFIYKEKYIPETLQTAIVILYIALKIYNFVCVSDMYNEHKSNFGTVVKSLLINNLNYINTKLHCSQLRKQLKSVQFTDAKKEKDSMPISRIFL